MLPGVERPWRAPLCLLWPLLMAVAVPAFPGCCAQTYVGCFVDTANAPTFTVSAINIQGSMTVEQCVVMCKMEAYVYAGLTENATCQCSVDSVNVPSLVVSTAVVCNVSCVDGKLCGGLDASALSVYKTGGGPLNFTMTVVHTPDVSLTIALTPLILNKETFLIDIGTGTALLQLNESTSPLITGSYIIPGNYTVSVVGMADGVNDIFTLSEQVVVPGISSVEAVSCPLVWEPDEVYLCNATVTLGEPEDVFTANFVSADRTVNSDFARIGSFLLRVGEPVPLGYSPAMLPSGNTSATVVTFSEYAIVRPSMLYAVEFYAMEQGIYTWKVERPSCAAGSYCVFAGGCLDSCPFDSIYNAYTCPAPKAFCSSKGTCGDAGVCTAAGAAATWAVVSTGSVTAPGATGMRATLAAPVALFPGDTLVVTGNLAASPDLYLPGDTVDGLATNTHHVANMVLKELVPVQLAHTCLVVGNDVTLTVTNKTATTGISNITACQRNITDVIFDVLDVNTDAWNSSVNLINPYFCWAGALYTHNFRAKFTVAGPMELTVTFDPDWGYNATLNDSTDYPFTGSLYTVLVPFTIPTDEVHTAKITAKNLHNTYYMAPTHSITIIAQYPVLSNWVMEPKAAIRAYLVPPTTPTFTFTDTLAGDFPTGASVRIDWKDGSPPAVYIFVHTGDKKPVITHNYTVDGIYNPEALIYNSVSGYNTTCTVTIFEDILNFNIVNGYYNSPTATVSRGGFGKIKNQYPMDKNLTFFPRMTQGTVDTYEVRFTTNNSLIFSYSPTDQFNPLVDPFSYHFAFETFLNITVKALNQLQSVSVDLFLEIVGQVLALQINDFAIVSKPNEVKVFEFTFERVGGGSCLIVDWGDGSLLEAFGEELTCHTNFSGAHYNPNIELEVAMNFTHVYPPPVDPTVKHKVYNITGYAYNQLGTTEYMLLFPITDLACAPPTVTISDQVLNYQSAPTKFRGEDNTLIAIGATNCNITQKTKKRWQILQVDGETGQVTTAVVIMDVITSWNKPELVIPKRFLAYGFYKAVYTLTMWDPPVLDTSLTFQRQAETYFEIVKTPLVGKMTVNSVSKVRRGPTQFAFLEPAVYSEDPDYPDVKNFTAVWHCREVSETLPAAGALLPLSPLVGGGTGCFGYGPGTLSYTGKSLNLTGAEFVRVGTYEVVAVVGKDTRTAKAIIQVEVMAEDVPLLEIGCITPSLCSPAADGSSVYVNPSNRLPLTSKCIDVCGNPDTITTVWSAVDQNGNIIPINGNGPELVLEVESFFLANPRLTSFTLTANVKNENGAVGSTSFFFKVNQAPVAPYHVNGAVPVPATVPNSECQVYPATGRSLIDIFTLTCDFWTDPENIGVKDYTVQLVFKETPTAPPTVLVNKPHPNVGVQTMELVFPAATFDIAVVVADVWGATTTHQASVNFTAAMITEEELASVNIDALLAVLAGAGNTGMMTMVIAAQSSVSSQASWLDLTDPSLTPEELKARQLLVAQQNLKALQSINANTNFDSLAGLSAASGAVAQIMNAASKSPQSALTIGLESRDMVLGILEKIGDGVERQHINDMNALSSLATDVSTISSAIVLGYDEILGSAGCSVIPELDFSKADFLAYDTDIGYDYEMVVPASVSGAKQCNVKDTTKNGATSTIDRANAVVESMGLSILGLMVVGDSKDIKSGNGMEMCLKMHKGNDLPGSWWCGTSFFDFPSSFCPQGQGCRPPISSMAKEWPASTYQAPGSASKLARGSKVLDVDLFQRDRTKIDVKNVGRTILIGLPRTMNKREDNTMPDFELINATDESAKQRIPVMYSTFFVNETQNSATVEIIPSGSPSRLFVLLSKGTMPTLRNHSLYKLGKDMTFVNGTNILEWFLPSKKLGGQGQYFIGVGEFSANVTGAVMDNPVNTTAKDVQAMTQNYQLRVYTSGCYFRDTSSGEWVNDDLHVLQANHTRTLCETNHLTSFGPGFAVAPNTIDFSYVFANMGFVDNLTIYVTIMICAAIFILMFIWARWQDGKDEKLVGSAPLPDNRPEDKYLYEIIVSTGNKMEAQTNSLVQFTLTGDHGESDVRTFGDAERKIFRKSATDAFVMATDRPLGSLHFLRIWHDNSGKGPNASWYLAYVVIRDVQTGERFEFIFNDWLAVEKTGMIETLIPTASDEDKKSFRHLFTNVSNKSIADHHLWFSIFLRPPRSRFTRCQRVGSCFALLFQSMLANAMFYETVPEVPMSGGLNIGPFLMTSEQVTTRSGGVEERARQRGSPDPNPPGSGCLPPLDS